MGKIIAVLLAFAALASSAAAKPVESVTLGLTDAGQPQITVQHYRASTWTVAVAEFRNAATGQAYAGAVTDQPPTDPQATVTLEDAPVHVDQSWSGLLQWQIWCVVFEKRLPAGEVVTSGAGFQLAAPRPFGRALPVTRLFADPAAPLRLGRARHVTLPDVRVLARHATPPPSRR